MRMRASEAIVSVAAILCVTGASLGQTGPRLGQYPDVIVSSVGGSYDSGSGGMGGYGAANGWAAYAIGSDSCNIGANGAIWIASNNQHPVIGGAVYRSFNGRFEQIGMSWLKHGFCAADNCSSGNSSGGQQGCLNIRGPAVGTTGCVTDHNSAGGCDWLGDGRATDTYGQGLNGSQGYLGPRSEVNAYSGVYPYPYVRQGSNPNSCLNKRLLVRTTDLDPANYPRYNASTNPTGAQYFGEVVYIVTDEWPTERYNNYSYRRINVGNLTTGPSGCNSQYYSMDFIAGAGNLTVAMHPAIDAWRAVDPSVVIATGDAPNDGRFYVGAKVTNLGGGYWSYEYAVFNMNSDRGAGSFSIPKANSSALQISDVGFHAPEYHSGEPYALKTWDSTVDANTISWSSDPYTLNANANAIRWSTLYNFRFIANQAPKTAANSPVRIGLFKPGVQINDANYIEIAGLPVPGDPPVCRADFNGVGGLNTQDIFDYLNAWFAGDIRADFNGVNGLEVQDVFDFINAWFVGCP
jgi:hypothetical protein